jgi:hypothetical protein
LDYEHFLGVDGTGRGGHKAGAGIDGATECSRWVQTPDDPPLVYRSLIVAPHVRVTV